MEWIDNIALI